MLATTLVLMVLQADAVEVLQVELVVPLHLEVKVMRVVMDKVAAEAEQGLSVPLGQAV